MIAYYVGMFLGGAFCGLIAVGCLTLIVNLAYQVVAHINRPTPVFPDNLQCVKCGSYKISTDFHSIRSTEKASIYSMLPSDDEWPAPVRKLAISFLLAVLILPIIWKGYVSVVGFMALDDVMVSCFFFGLSLGDFLGLSVTPWYAVSYLSCRITHHCKACGFKHHFEASSPQ